MLELFEFKIVHFVLGVDEGVIGPAYPLGHHALLCFLHPRSVLVYVIQYIEVVALSGV